jgi:hypothetical protein
MGTVAPAARVIPEDFDQLSLFPGSAEHRLFFHEYDKIHSQPLR